MCGFFGVFDLNGLSENEYFQIDSGLEKIKYRGPDDRGSYKDKKFYVGFNRLSIVDLKAKSQPFVSENDQFILVCNGEIYNFKELREQLISKYNFKTNTDTEVLLYGFQEWGDDLWIKVRGMFSAVIYDKKNVSVKLIRDHAGIKPLHYIIKGNKIYFSNDIKCFLENSFLDIDVNKNSLLSYLSFRYVLGENTFYKQIKDLLPGKILTFSYSIEQKTFWELDTNYKSNYSESEAIEILDSKLENAVKSHLIGDVGKGIFISGGLDSSLIAHYMKKHQENIEGFATSINNNEYDESEFIKLICDNEKIKLNTIQLDKNTFINNIDNIINYKSEPASIPHETGFFLMSREMSKKIKVVLSGEGADELFGGYGRIFKSPLDYYKKKIFNIQYNEMDHFLDRYSIFTKMDKETYLNKDYFKNQFFDDDSINYIQRIFDKVKNKNYFEKMYFIMFKIHLINMLNRLDRMTMGSSIEARVPFLDRDLIDFVFSLPSNLKIRWRSKLDKYSSIFKDSDDISEKYDIPKYILKKVAESKISKKLVYRKKIAFPLPMNEWMKKELGDYSKDVLLSRNSKIQDILNIKNVEKKLNKKKYDGKEDLEGKKIWMLVNLERWLQKQKNNEN